MRPRISAAVSPPRTATIIVREMHDDAERQHRRARPLREPQQRLARAARCALTRHALPDQRRQRRRALQSGDRRGRRELLRAALGAALVRVAGVASGVARDRREALGARAVARIVDERPRAIERRRTEIVAIPADDVAARVADAAADALDRGVDRAARLRRRRDRRELVAARRRRDERPFARAHLSKNSRMSVTRSRITGRFASGAISSAPSPATASTCVRQVQRARPLTVIAHEPHMPTRHAKR